MGTHPIFESDFDCLTEMENLDQSRKILESEGLFVDDLSRVRVLDPETADASAENVKKRKLEAIGARTKLQTLNRENELKKTQLLQKIEESHLLMERLRSEHDALKKIEQTQNSTLQQLNG